jgi:hypothetical protein
VTPLTESVVPPSVSVTPPTERDPAYALRIASMPSSVLSNTVVLTLLR